MIGGIFGLGVVLGVVKKVVKKGSKTPDFGQKSASRARARGDPPHKSSMISFGIEDSLLERKKVSRIREGFFPFLSEK